MSDSAQAVRSTGVTGEAVSAQAVAALSNDLQARLARIREDMTRIYEPVRAASLCALANRQNYREVANGFVESATATAFLNLIGPQTLDVRVAQEGLSRAQLTGAEAAAVMVNHALTPEGGSNPLFGNSLTALLTLATTLTAALGYVSNARWAQLAGNLLPHHIADYGTPAAAIKAAIVLLSCQHQVQARLVPFNFQGAPIDASFRSVAEAAERMRNGHSGVLSEADVVTFTRHVMDIERLPKYPEHKCSDNVLLLRIWMCSSLDDVFVEGTRNDPNVVPAAVWADPVFTAMRTGDPQYAQSTMTRALLRTGAFSENAPAFRSALGPSGEPAPAGTEWTAADPETASNPSSSWVPPAGLFAPEPWATGTAPTSTARSATVGAPESTAQQLYRASTQHAAGPSWASAHSRSAQL